MKNFTLALDLVRSFRLGAEFNVDEVGPRNPLFPYFRKAGLQGTHPPLRPDSLRFQLLLPAFLINKQTAAQLASVDEASSHKLLALVDSYLADIKQSRHIALCVRIDACRQRYPWLRASKEDVRLYCNTACYDMLPRLLHSLSISSGCFGK